MIRARNVEQGYRSKLTEFVSCDISTDAANLKTVLVSPRCAVKIKKIICVYRVATNATAITFRTIKVGTYANDDLYYVAVPSVSTALGTVEELTPISSAQVPAGTAVTICFGTGADTNTGEIDVAVEYEPV